MVFDGQKFTGRAPAQFNSGTNSERKKEERNKTVEKMKAACPRRGSSRQGFFSGIEYRDVTPPGPQVVVGFARDAAEAKANPAADGVAAPTTAANHTARAHRSRMPVEAPLKHIPRHVV